MKFLFSLNIAITGKMTPAGSDRVGLLLAFFVGVASLFVTIYFLSR